MVKSYPKGGQKVDKSWTKMGRFWGIFEQNPVQICDKKAATIPQRKLFYSLYAKRRLKKKRG